MTFKQDLKFGEHYEIKFAELTKCKYKKMNGNFKDYDVKIYTPDNKQLTYEIKTDKMTYHTGNIAIEYSCRNKPSGITSSTADYWIYNEIIDYNESKGLNHDYQYNMYVIPTKDLVHMINNKQYHKITMGGDGFKVKLFLFKKHLFNKYKVENFEEEFYIYKEKDYSDDELEEMLRRHS